MKQCSCLACTHGCTLDCGFLFKSFGIGSIIDQILETCTGDTVLPLFFCTCETCTEAEQRYEHERIRAGRNTVMYGNMVFFTTVPH